MLFCAWWPWGNGKTISIRMAPWKKETSVLEKGKQNEALKRCFGI
jgi:hypothetical protein